MRRRGPFLLGMVGICTSADHVAARRALPLYCSCFSRLAACHVRCAHVLRTNRHRRRKLITDAARELHSCHMARFDERSGNLYVTELGRVASHYYIRHSSILVFNEHLKPHMTEADVLSMIAQSSGGFGWLDGWLGRQQTVVLAGLVERFYCYRPAQQQHTLFTLPLQLASPAEFENLAVREEELPELDTLVGSGWRRPVCEGGKE